MFGIWVNTIHDDRNSSGFLYSFPSTTPFLKEKREDAENMKDVLETEFEGFQYTVVQLTFL